MIASLANHLWQSTLFALAVWAIARLLREHGAAVRYRLWLAASLKFLVPFSLLTALGRGMASGAPVPIVSGWPSAFEKIAQPVAVDSSAALTYALLAAWFCGAIILAAASAISASRMAAIVRDAVPCRLPGLEASRLPGLETSRLAGFEASGLAVKCSPAQIEPALVGIFRPVLLLPEGIAERLGPDQLQAVLAHELCHRQRRDNLSGALHMLVEALFWFYPFVRWIGTRLVEERERACDEAVVAAGHDREGYAEAILDVCQFYIASSTARAPGISGADLKRRVTSIMRYRAMIPLSIAKKLLIAGFAACTLALPVVVGLVTAPGAAFGQDREEFLPIVKVAPIYPAEAVAQRLEGYVIVEFTVTTTGSVKDLDVVESSSPVFERAALDAARKFKYEPRLENGRPVEVPGVRNKITFVLER
jgi:bla regulator protein BlaR1